MSIEQEKMIVEALPSLYPLKDYEEDAIHTVLDALPHWISCSERMPEEREWLGTKRFGTTISEKVHITFESPNGERFTRFMSFQNGKLSNYDQNIIDTLYPGSRPIAWMPPPEAWKGGIGWELLI